MSELVRNSHIDRALRMEAGGTFRIIVVEQALASPCLPSSLVIPFTFSASDPLPPFPSPRFHALRSRMTPAEGPSSARDKIIPFTMRINLPRDPGCIIAKTFPVAVSSLPSTRKRFLRTLLEARDIPLPSRRQDDNVLQVSPGRQCAPSIFRYV